MIDAYRFKYVPFIDGLRALAILSVLSFHGMGPISASIVGRGGWSGVDCFFVISGFLITSLLLQEIRDTGWISIKNFMLRRMLRIWPAYYAFLLVVAIFNPDSSSHIAMASGIAAIFMTDYDIAMNWGHAFGSGLDITWSLAVEEKFYLLWPALLLRLRQHALTFAVAALVLCQIWKAWLITHGADWIRLSAAFDTHIDAIMWGCVASLLMANDRCRSFLEKALSKPFVPILLAVVLYISTRKLAHPDDLPTIATQIMFWTLRLPLHTGLLALTILCLHFHKNSIVTKFLTVSPMVWIGRISYSLYLWHGLTFKLAHHATQQLDRRIEECACLVVSVLAAAASYYFIEKPFLRMKHKFEVRANPSSSSVAVETEKERVAVLRR